MKRSELAVSVLLVPLDFAALLLAAWSAYSIRRLGFVTDIRPIIYDLSVGQFIQNASIVAVFWLGVFALAGLYRRRATDRSLAEFGRIFFACSVGLVLITVLVFLRGELFSSRFIILAAWGLAIVYVTVGRLLVKQIMHAAFRRGVAAHRVAVIGDGEATSTIVQNIQSEPELGYVVVATLSPNASAFDELRALVAEGKLDEILVVDTGSSPEKRQLFLEFAEEHHLIFRYAPDVVFSSIGQPVIDFDLGVPVIEVPETTLVGWGRVVKRLFDIVGSIIGLIFFLPLFIVVASIIWLDSGRPIIYRSERIGRGGSFTLLKFRTLKIEYCTGNGYGGEQAEKYERQLIEERNVRQGPVPKIVDDPRWTRAGKWLRRFSVDELPQLWNVLEGNMSLIGPRPHLPREVAKYEHHHKKVLAIKPGMSGLAQVSGRSDLAFDEEVRLDRYYIEHWSLWLDLRILLKTVYVIFERRVTF